MEIEIQEKNFCYNYAPGCMGIPYRQQEHCRSGQCFAWSVLVLDVTSTNEYNGIKSRHVHHLLISLAPNASNGPSSSRPNPHIVATNHSSITEIKWKKTIIWNYGSKNTCPHGVCCAFSEQLDASYVCWVNKSTFTTPLISYSNSIPTIREIKRYRIAKIHTIA